MLPVPPLVLPPFLLQPGALTRPTRLQLCTRRCPSHQYQSGKKLQMQWVGKPQVGIRWSLFCMGLNAWLSNELVSQYHPCASLETYGKYIWSFGCRDTMARYMCWGD